MKRLALVVLLSLPFCLAQAQPAAAPATPLSQDDATQLLRGATVDFTSTRGNKLNWKNELDGTMLASSVGSKGRSTTQKGSWKIDEKGRFCVSIDWPSNLEEWCRYVVKDGDIYYLTRSNGERVSPLTVTR
jgi:hypothetical protein